MTDRIKEYIDNYTFEFGDGRCHTPTEHERAMLTDFAHGLVDVIESMDGLCESCGGTGHVPDYGPFGTDFYGAKPCSSCNTHKKEQG